MAKTLDRGSSDLIDIPQAVLKSILEHYPKEAGDIILDLKYSNLQGCWYFYLNGMYIGIEPDGYIHT